MRLLFAAWFSTILLALIAIEDAKSGKAIQPIAPKFPDLRALPVSLRVAPGKLGRTDFPQLFHLVFLSLFITSKLNDFSLQPALVWNFTITGRLRVQMFFTFSFCNILMMQLKRPREGVYRRGKQTKVCIRRKCSIWPELTSHFHTMKRLGLIYYPSLPSIKFAANFC